MKTVRNPFTVFAAFSVFALASSAQASGFVCTSGEGYTAKLYNYTDPNLGTRNPSVFVISHETQGTLLVRKGADIRKHNRSNTVQYVVNGDEQLGADTAILQLDHKYDGREITGTVDGQLILIQDGTRDRVVIDLQCERYLKN